MKRVYGWACVRVGVCTGGRAGVRYVITKFSQMDSLPNFLTHGAPLCARFARARSSAKKTTPFATPCCLWSPRTVVHFTLFYWFKSRRWQCKSNRACAKVTWKPRKQQTWRLILLQLFVSNRKVRWRKVHSGPLAPGRSMTPGFKPFTYCAFCSSKL